MGEPVRIHSPEQARPPSVRGVDDRDETGALAERNPEAVPVRAEAHVMRPDPDEDAPNDPLLGEVDHVELPTLVVRHVCKPVEQRRDKHDVRRPEAAQDLSDP